MKILRLIVFLLSATLSLWLLGPLYKGVVHIGMLYPQPFLFMFMFFAAKPEALISLFKKFKALMIVLTSLLGVGIIIVSVMVGLLLYYAGNTAKNEKTVIVLGCQVTGKTPSLMLYDRMTTALEYVNANEDSIVIASGGKGAGEQISEAEAIKTFLVNKGVDEKRIILEDKSTNTKENIAFSSNLIQEKGLNKDIAVVTDGFHQFRAAYFSKQNNLEYSSLPCKTRWYFTASYYSREILAVIKMLIL